MPTPYRDRSAEETSDEIVVRWGSVAYVFERITDTTQSDLFGPAEFYEDGETKKFEGNTRMVRAEVIGELPDWASVAVRTAQN